LIKFKVTLEILTPEVKKETQKFTPQLVEFSYQGDVGYSNEKHPNLTSGDVQTTNTSLNLFGGFSAEAL